MLAWFSSITGSYALALLLYALLFKIVFLPFSIKQQKNQIAMAKLTPKIEAIRAKYRGRTDQVTMRKQQEEIMELPMGALIITLETGIRFLTDYLNGDTYFRIHYPQHNLDRARNQFALVRDMEKKMPRMREIVKKYI